MTTIWFNNIKLDLGDSVITENRQINSFFEIKDRQTNYTNKFTLPETPTNRTALEYFGSVGSQSNVPYSINNVSVYRNGVPTIQNGKGIVNKLSYGKGYSLNIQFGNNGIYDEIANKKLTDLDFSSINHNFSVNVVTQRYFTDYNSGYKYCLGDFGFVNNNNTSEVALPYQVPSVYIKWLWDKIFEESGFTYSYVGDNNLFESEDFEKRLITIEQPFIMNQGDLVDFSTLFNITQKDFIKSVMQDFGLMLSRESNSSNYRFISVGDFLTDQDNSIDYSEKLNRVLSVDASLKGYAKTNYLRYNYDNSDDDFADGSFEIDNETIGEEREMFRSPFKAPEISGININGNNLYSFAHFDPSFNEDGTLKQVKAKKTKAYLHTFTNEVVDIVFNFEGIRQPYNGLASIVNFQGLTYSENISKYYTNFISNISRPELYTVEMVFNSIDVLEFDFFKQIYIRQLGGYFYMNKIKSFRVGRVTKCELIKINPENVFGAYSNAYSEGYLI